LSIKVSEATVHRKPHVKHQLMITKLCTFDEQHRLEHNVKNLEKLKSKISPTNYFCGRIKIPKFSYEVKGKQLTIKMEYMFGEQLNFWVLGRNYSKWKDIIFEDMVIADDKIGFNDYTLDNFIIRGARPLGNNEPNWEIAYVDLEAYYHLSDLERIIKFKNTKEWQLEYFRKKRAEWATRYA
jgi:hypothetical protein